MAVMTYELWLDPKGRPVEKDKTGRHDDRKKSLVGILALAKSRSANAPLEFASEMIAGELARTLRLPVAGGVFVNKERDRWYASFNFNSFAKEDLPDVIPVMVNRIIATRPDIAAGIVAFDMWVCNEDRHDKNIAWNDDEEEVFIFDQGEALMGSSDTRRRLERIRRLQLLGIGDHCLVNAIKDTSTLNPWFAKIEAIPEGFICEIISEAETLGLTRSDGKFLADFLLERRSSLPLLVSQNIAEFRGAQSLFMETVVKMPPVRKRTVTQTAKLLSRHSRFCRECGSRFRKVWRGCK